MKFMVYLNLLVTFAVSALVGYQFNQISQSRADARTKALATWHTVICSLEQATLASKTVPPARKQLIVKFYDDLLRSIDAPTCGLEVK